MRAKCHKCKECIRIEVFGWSKFVYCNKVSAFGEEKIYEKTRVL